MVDAIWLAGCCGLRQGPWLIALRVGRWRPGPARVVKARAAPCQAPPRNHRQVAWLGDGRSWAPNRSGASLRWGAAASVPASRSLGTLWSPVSRCASHGVEGNGGQLGLWKSALFSQMLISPAVAFPGPLESSGGVAVLAAAKEASRGEQNSVRGAGPPCAALVRGPRACPRVVLKGVGGAGGACGWKKCGISLGTH